MPLTRRGPICQRPPRPNPFWPPVCTPLATWILRPSRRSSWGKEPGFSQSRLGRSVNRIGVGYLLEDIVDLRLTDKVALVTGSTAGIGFAIARSLAAEGARVYVNGRTQERVYAAVAAIRSLGATIKVDGIVADFSSSAGAEAVI